MVDGAIKIGRESTETSFAVIANDMFLYSLEPVSWLYLLVLSPRPPLVTWLIFHSLFLSLLLFFVICTRFRLGLREVESAKEADSEENSMKGISLL